MTTEITVSDNETFMIKPFWKKKYKNSYEKCWLPTDNNFELINRNLHTQWFEHQTQVCELDSQWNIPVHKQWKCKDRRPIRKSARQQKALPEGQLYRTKLIRMYPSSDQKKLLQTWFRACRYTYNWALYKLRVLKDCGVKVSYDGKYIRNLVVPEKNIPVRYQWMLAIPKDVREKAAFELGDALKNSVDKYRSGRGGSDHQFRSVTDEQCSLTISSKGLSKNQIPFHINFFPSYNVGHIRLKEDIVVNGIEMKVKFHRSGKYYLHYTYIVDQKTTDSDDVVAIDPGVKPAWAYYSPNGLESGHIGTANDVETLLRLAEKADDISSMLSREDLSHKRRYRLRRRRFKLFAKIRNRVIEMHKYMCKFMCKRYGIVVLPKFPVKSMIQRSDRRIQHKAVRNLLNWRHGMLRTRMQQKSEEFRVELRIGGEAYTSATCGKCGKIKKNLGGSMVYGCDNCDLVIDRQLNGARNIFLKDIRRFV